MDWVLVWSSEALWVDFVKEVEFRPQLRVSVDSHGLGDRGLGTGLVV